MPGYKFEKDIIYEEIIVKDRIGIGNCIPVGSLSFDLSRISKAQKLTLEVLIENTPFRNRWDFWVYPEDKEADTGKVFITDKLDRKTEEVLRKGGSVLLLTYGKVGRTKGAQVAIGFSSIFWNTAWTNNQPPHTLGILCDPKHPVFREFPDRISQQLAMVGSGFTFTGNDTRWISFRTETIIQPIDTWFENRRLALAFEAKTDGGKLMVCSIDLKEIAEETACFKTVADLDAELYE